MMWTPVKLPYLFERMIGFAMMPTGIIAIIAYDGIHMVKINDSEFLGAQYYDFPEGKTLYNSKTQRLSWNDVEYPVLGLHGGLPAMKNQWGETLVLKTQEEGLQIVDREGQTTVNFKFRDLSGDWAYATFSTDGRLAVLGLPYDLFVFQRGN